MLASPKFKTFFFFFGVSAICSLTRCVSPRPVLHCAHLRLLLMWKLTSGGEGSEEQCARAWNKTILPSVKTALVCQDYCFIPLMVPWKKKWTHSPAHVHSQSEVFHNFFFFCHFYLSFCAFHLNTYNTYLQRCQFEGVIPSNECIYHPRLYSLL